MKRYLATYTLLPGHGELVNHITTLGDDNRFISCVPLRKELPGTTFVGRKLCLLPSHVKPTPGNTCATFFASLPPLSPGTPVQPLLLP